MDPLTFLPDELVNLLFYKLGYIDTVNMYKVSQRLRLLCNNIDLWKNKIELSKPGLYFMLRNKTLNELIDIYRRITTPGDLYTFGSNHANQSGFRSVRDIYRPQKVVDTDSLDDIDLSVSQVSCGNAYSGLVTSEGHVYTYGFDLNGNLGQNSVVLPTQIPQYIFNDEKISQIVCGQSHTIFVTSSGQCYACGSNNVGQLGIGDTENTPQPELISGLSEVVQAACGYWHTAFVTRTGQLYLCGGNNYGQLGLDITDKYIIRPTPIPKFNNIVQVSCGQFHTSFITNHGEIYTFGSGRYGKLGLGDTNNRNQPVKIDRPNDVIQVACGGSRTAFITKHGEIYICGANNIGQLGLGDTTERHLPTKIENYTDVVQVACGDFHTAFITLDGKLYMFGENFYGQLGLGNTEDKYLPQLVTSLNSIGVVQVSCGHDQTAIIVNEI